MRQTDIAIIGGGLAGSTAAAMLGRAHISAVLIDPHTIYPSDFRCEKLDATQVQLLRKTGLDEAIFAAATLDEEISVARFGRLIETKPLRQYGLLYDTLVNTMRAQIPSSVEVLSGKATAIATSAERQIVTLSNGDSISARLVVLSNGLNIGLRHNLGMTREVLSECHSITVGFNLEPVGKPRFDFRALTYFPERAADSMAYLTLFPIQSTMRANLFVYREMTDPWLKQVRTAPEQALLAIMPALRKVIGDFAVIGDVKIRPVDLCVTNGHQQPGVVLIGDAFATSCPAAGTGTSKVLTDVERLCSIHIPRWLATDGMGQEKIAAFYNDPLKTACDAASLDKAFYLRSLSIETGLAWEARRWARFLTRSCIGAWRRISPARSLNRQGVAVGGVR
jgi:2-polyprenyl-6-methoxyphenol hydroxylase-like FAD-dependent oxidoreductase